MTQRHSVRNGAGTLARMPDPVQGDADGEIRNGRPEPVPYLPRDPGRRARLLAALGIRNNPGQEEAVQTANPEEVTNG